MTCSRVPLVTAFQKPSTRRAALQLLDSVGGYLALWCAMAWAVSISWFLALPLAIAAGLLSVRVFIIFHDCGHGSFLRSRSANRAWGLVTGVLTWTPYDDWRSKHASHHGAVGNLDRRGVGDIWTLTVREYEAAGWWKRVAYRAARNPLVLLFVAPLFLFLVDHRLPSRHATARERRSVWLTSLAILAWAAAWSLVVGVLPYLILQVTVLAVAGAVGVWLFYSQHQFEGTYWRTSPDWNRLDAALRGSSFLKLPLILQWSTGNIGYHHIHHLDSRIPNYNLQACHESHPVFRTVPAVTILQSLRAFRLKLWDEAHGTLVRFRRRPAPPQDTVA
ncbi:MAG: fatty acid desaturase [Planctomycetes bacterium]|nr:fatty acid desaturase [Planctomycetota bacterium]